MRNRWNRLDNAAKIFPCSGSKTNTQVFRFSCELFEEINESILQEALDETIKIFDVYRSVLRRGLFWYYLEETDLRPIVKKEYKKLCCKIYDANVKNLLFEVTYYGARINIEVFHVLSDGTGAMHFLKLLVAKYLCRKYDFAMPSLDYDASNTQMRDDSFDRYYTGKKVPRQKGENAAQIKGQRYSDNRLRVTTGHMSVSGVLERSRGCKTTITNYLCALIVCSIGEELSLKARKKPIVLCVPVNLRKYYPSKSARNFFSNMYFTYRYPKEPAEFETVLKAVSEQMNEALTLEKLENNINGYLTVENNLFAKIIPLALKNIILKVFYKRSMKQSTITVSNVGVVKMPDELCPYIHSVDVCAGTNRLQASICSFQDVLSVNFTSPFTGTDIECGFFRRLVNSGIDVEITANRVEELE